MLHQIIKNLKNYPNHYKVFENALECLISHPHISGVLLGGSFSQGCGDIYSDIDFHIIVNDPYFEYVFSERATLAHALGQPLFCNLINDYLPEGKYRYAILYKTMVRVEFNYIIKSSLTPVINLTRRIILKDTNNFLENLQAESQKIHGSKIVPQHIIELNQKFWIWCWYTFGMILRGNVWQALDSINIIRHIIILPMLWVLNYIDVPSYRDVTQLPYNVDQLMKDTISQVEIVSLYAALRHEINLFLQLRNNACKKYDIVIDKEPEQLVLNEITIRWTQTIAKTSGNT